MSRRCLGRGGGGWNAEVLLRELRGSGYPGGYTILKDWLQPQRVAAAEELRKVARQER